MGARLVPGDPTPDVDELQAREDAHLAVPVDVEGPVRVQQLPARSGTSRSWKVNSTDTTVIAKADLTRGRLLVWTDTTSVQLSYDQASITAGTAAVLPVGLVVELRNCRRVYVRSTGADTTVSVLGEQWSE